MSPPLSSPHMPSPNPLNKMLDFTYCGCNCGDDSYDPFLHSRCGYGCSWDCNDSYDHSPAPTAAAAVAAMTPAATPPARAAAATLAHASPILNHIK